MPGKDVRWAKFLCVLTEDGPAICRVVRKSEIPGNVEEGRAKRTVSVGSWADGR
jgi:hypothetical protein